MASKQITLGHQNRSDAKDNTIQLFQIIIIIIITMPYQNSEKANTGGALTIEI